MVVTVHPSLVLRIPDQESRRAEYRRLVDDLRFCRQVLAGKAA
jgi:hypothetical protein